MSDFLIYTGHRIQKISPFEMSLHKLCVCTPSANFSKGKLKKKQKCSSHSGIKKFFVYFHKKLIQFKRYNSLNIRIEKNLNFGLLISVWFIFF